MSLSPCLVYTTDDIQLNDPKIKFSPHLQDDWHDLAPNIICLALNRLQTYIGCKQK